MSELWTTDKGPKYLEFSILIESHLSRIKIMTYDKEMAVRNLKILDSQIRFSEDALDIYKNKQVKIIRIQLVNRTKQDLKNSKENFNRLNQEVKRLTEELNKLSKEVDRLRILRDDSAFTLLRFEDYVERRKNRQ